MNAAPSAPLWQWDATELAGAIRRGQLSSREVVGACLNRIDAVNGKLNAIVWRSDDAALEAADAADAARAGGEELGPLHGVPVTIKTNTDQRGAPTDNGVQAFASVIATEDAPVVANLRRAGAIVVGRSNAPAFSMRIITNNALYGRTYNPRDRAVTPGGSSGGAGAAIAAGICPIAQGTDIAGSVRLPAACCGVIGLRAGLGRIPYFGTTSRVGRPHSFQLMATQGPLTRSIRDARLALSVMARGDARDTRWSDVPLVGPAPAHPIRVALVPEVPGGFTHPAQAAAVVQAGRHLERAGYAVETVLPPEFGAVIRTWHRLCSGDVLRALAPAVEQYGDPDAITSLRHWLDVEPPPADPNAVLDALAQRDRLLFLWQEFFQRYPIVVLPTLCDLPPKQDEDLTREGGRRLLESVRASLVSPLLGLCGLAIPVGSVGTLRTGVQIVAARFREDLALDAGEVIEAAEPPIVAIDPMW